MYGIVETCFNSVECSTNPWMAWAHIIMIWTHHPLKTRVIMRHLCRIPGLWNWSARCVLVSVAKRRPNSSPCWTSNFSWFGGACDGVQVWTWQRGTFWRLWLLRFRFFLYVILLWKLYSRRFTTFPSKTIKVEAIDVQMLSNVPIPWSLEGHGLQWLCGWRWISA